MQNSVDTFHMYKETPAKRMKSKMCRNPLIIKNKKKCIITITPPSWNPLNPPAEPRNDHLSTVSSTLQQKAPDGSEAWGEPRQTNWLKHLQTVTWHADNIANVFYLSLGFPYICLCEEVKGLWAEKVTAFQKSALTFCGQVTCCHQAWSGNNQKFPSQRSEMLRHTGG